MPISPAHKTAIDQVINVITLTKAPRGKRILCEMFLDLVDREEHPEYYEVKAVAIESNSALTVVNRRSSLNHGASTILGCR
jgi:hypothetical protein